MAFGSNALVAMPLMKDSEVIVQAYEDALKRLFSNLFDAYAVANNTNDQTLAEQRFQEGVRKARETRDKAIGLLS